MTLITTFATDDCHLQSGVVARRSDNKLSIAIIGDKLHTRTYIEVLDIKDVSVGRLKISHSKSAVNSYSA